MSEVNQLSRTESQKDKTLEALDDLRESWIQKYDEDEIRESANFCEEIFGS